MVTVVIFLIVLAVLIFVHELGHFLLAKAFGIRVGAFKIGFGPKIFAWTPTKKDGTRGETEYGVNMIPFGGYVKIFGENPDDDEKTTFLASTPAFVKSEKTRSLAHKSRWKQVIVLAGGVFFNVLFAWVLYAGLFSHGVTATADGFSNYTKYFSDERIMVTDVVKGSPADSAGLEIGDTLIGNSISDIQNNILGSKGSQVDIAYSRDGVVQDAKVVPTKSIVADKYAIGIAMNDVADMKLPFFTAIYEGGHYTIEIFQQTVVGLYDFVVQIFHGTANFADISGPVGIAGIVGDAARLGMTYLLMITALISINLAVINLIPFPALDGGRILFVIIESIIRRPIPAKFTNWVNLVGFGLLMLLMVVVTYKDIVKLVQ